MADLTETQTWESGIYMWQTDDPVIGGPAGLDNLPTRQLANRTGWLRKQIEDHAAASDPHPQYLTQTEGAAIFDQVNAASLAVSNHASANDPHPLYQNQTRADARYSQLGHAHADMYEAKNAVATHAAASDPHPQYLTQTEADARYSASGSDGGMANHLAAADPHAMYLNLARANALYALIAHNHNGVYEPAGATLAHTNSADPHPQYHTNARGDARYSLLGHGHGGVYDPAGSAENARVWTYNWVVSTFALPSWVSNNFVPRNSGGDWFWVGDHLIQRGLVHPGDIPSGNYAYEVYISFPVAFPGTPTVTVSRSGNATTVVAGTRSETPYGFNLLIEEWSQAAQDSYINWIAIF